MHELAITQSLLEIVNQEVAKHAISKVTTVKVKVGKRRAVEPTSLTFCFETLTKDTLMEGAELVIDVVPVRGKCSECGALFEVDGLLFTCPNCSGRNIKITGGRELYIEEIQGD
jgi:hydrogenase nickel incorporation protein HypA/HybF